MTLTLAMLQGLPILAEKASVVAQPQPRKREQWYQSNSPMSQALEIALEMCLFFVL
jgi:hypothetical protein